MKEIKLIKVGEHYDLYHRISEENLIIGFASTDNTFVNKLSLKNCQEIENGYDLDGLAENYAKGKSSSDVFKDAHKRDFIEGAKAILEIIGDKKFSEGDMSKAWSEGYHRKVDELNGNGLRYFDKFIQSLQQTEWDVEIVMEGFVDDEGIYCGEKPILDTDNCLILKRK